MRKNKTTKMGDFCRFRNPKRISKKAALELSVNAIVILILAIVMLGLGLGFVRGMFSKVTTQFEEQIATEPNPSAPSGSEPITLSRESIVTHAKDSEVLKVALYNPSNSDWANATPALSCSSGFGSFDSIQVNNKTINQGESQSYNVLTTIPTSAGEGTYLCKIEITAVNGSNDLVTLDYTKDFTIKVIR